MARQLPLNPPPPRLAEKIDENLRLLGALAAEMQRFEEQLQALAAVGGDPCLPPACLHCTALLRGRQLERGPGLVL